MNTNSKTLVAGFENHNFDAGRLASIIEKKGGNIWEGKRAYFGEDQHAVAAMKMKYQAYNVYFDIVNKAIVMEFNEEDAENISDINEYKKAFIDSLKS